jgi:DNA-binding transcriptional LysR family regulator
MDKSHSRFLRAVSFRQLQVFESIARSGSFTAAARELYLTQPTVSAQMKKLEEGVGASLFEQVGRKIFLTKAGKSLLETSQRIFTTVDEFESELNSNATVDHGELSLSGVTTTEFFFPMLLGVFCRQYPMINVTLTICERDTLMERITNNRDDLYLMGQPPKQDNIEAEFFITNPLALICRPDHTLAGAVQIPFLNLHKENFLLREPGSGTRIALQRFLNEQDIEIQARMELNSNEAIKQAVMSGLGIALLSKFSVANELRDGSLTILDVQDFPLQENWFLVSYRKRTLSPVAELFKKFVMREGKALLTATMPDSNDVF